jgi:transposase
VRRAFHINIGDPYRGLSDIEETFRVAKLFLKIRPVYLQRTERIKAHVLVCYLSLLVLRLLETKVLKGAFSFHEIVHSLRDYNCAMIAPNNYFFFAYDKLALELAKRSGTNAKLETRTLSQIKNLFKSY